MAKEVNNLKELQHYVNILEDLHELKFNNYDVLIKELLIEFGIKTNIEQIRQLYEPTVVDDIIDLKIQYRNIN